MKEFMRKLSDKAIPRRHYLIVKEANTLEVLDVIDTERKTLIDTNLSVGRLDRSEDCDEWFIEFYATNEQWSTIVNTLKGNGFELSLMYPPENLFVAKKV